MAVALAKLEEKIKYLQAWKEKRQEKDDEVSELIGQMKAIIDTFRSEEGKSNTVVNANTNIGDIDNQSGTLHVGSKK